jgi:hypothetical protein
VLDPEVLPLVEPDMALVVPEDPVAPLETVPLLVELPLVSAPLVLDTPLPSPPLDAPAEVEEGAEPLLVPEPVPCVEPDCALPFGLEEQPAATNKETRQPTRERLRIRPPKREDFAKYRQRRVNGKTIEKVSSW